MLRYITIFALSGLLVWLFTPVAERLSYRLGLIDNPSKRKPHAKPTPLMGGWAMLISFVISSALAVPLQGTRLGILLGAIVAFGVGLVDDYTKSRGKELGALPKILGQILAALILASCGVRIFHITNPFSATRQLIFFSPLISYLMTVLWVVGVMNIINFMDGLDGLAAGITCIAASTLALVAWQMNQTPSATLAVIVVGITLGFLRFNKYPASIFMGDMGSNFLGFLLGAISVGGSFKSATFVGMIVPILALGLPIADTAMNVIRRTKNGQPFYVADLGHTHHRLQRWGLNQVQTVYFMYLISICFSLTALIFLFASRH
ncbi:MAG TPA: undecaprenyl/decaprenyl-phosphate alpha-N-acetylglucosaminyl 1-phosphate transferase [Firmicutes bacterium]|nr:undecaprenyl/decaprenyl-phosphate alpha-N-acetylglucosaminyl 1-phosphate transferase [Bacillota bacterium]